jgi:hypothetical protein
MREDVGPTLHVRGDLETEIGWGCGDLFVDSQHFSS